MNHEMRKVISDFVSGFRDCYNIGVPVVALDNVVSQLNGTIVETESLDSSIDGVVKKSSEDSFIIELRSNVSILRRRFTIAHELGHLFFDMGYLIDKDLWRSVPEGQFYRRTANMNNSEAIANEFAACLLMPKNEFINKFVACTNPDSLIVDMKSIASYFIVSEDAALTRAKWLGLIAW